MRKRTSRIYPDGITECNEVYAPFSDGWQYCDAIYKCDENGVMTCLWEKLAGKQLVKKPYTRISAMVYINGITYALMAIYTSSSYTTKDYYIAYYDAQNKRWIAISNLTYVYGRKENVYKIASSDNAILVSLLRYASSVYTFYGHKYAVVSKENLDELTFADLENGNFLGLEELVSIYPDFDGEYWIETSKKFHIGMIGYSGYYKQKKADVGVASNISQYKDYNGNVLAESDYGMPAFIILGKEYRLDTFTSGSKKGISYVRYDGSTLKMSNEEISNVFGDSNTRSLVPYKGTKYYNKYVYPVISSHYHDTDNGIVTDGTYFRILSFDGEKTEKIFEEKISDLEFLTSFTFVSFFEMANGMFVSNMKYKNGNVFKGIVFSGFLNTLQKVDYDFKNNNATSALFHDNEICYLISDESNDYYNYLAKVSGSSLKTVTIDTYAWEE